MQPAFDAGDGPASGLLSWASGPRTSMGRDNSDRIRNDVRGERPGADDHLSLVSGVDVVCALSNVSGCPGVADARISQKGMPVPVGCVAGRRPIDG